jgi:hypothetical protein
MQRQAVAGGIPAMHGAESDFDLQQRAFASMAKPPMVTSPHVSKGGTSRGPVLEDERAGGLCGFCLRRRDPARSVLKTGSPTPPNQ